MVRRGLARLRRALRARTGATGRPQPTSLLEEAPGLGWQFRFSEIVQFHGFVRIVLLLTVRGEPVVHEVRASIGARSFPCRFASAPTGADTVELRIDLLAGDRTDFDRMLVEVVAVDTNETNRLFHTE